MIDTDDEFDAQETADAFIGRGRFGDLPSDKLFSGLPGITTKIPPSFDGTGSFFAYEDAIDDWEDITELEKAKRGPALRNRLLGGASIYKRIFDRDQLKNEDNGVSYFKRTLRQKYVKGAHNVSCTDSAR